MRNFLQYLKTAARRLPAEKQAATKPDDASGYIIKKAVLLTGGLIIMASSAFATSGLPNTQGETTLAAPFSAEVVMQASTDDAQILQKCIDLAALKALYPKHANGTYKQLAVLQHGVAFPMSISVSHNGQVLAFLNKDQVKTTNADAYFYFHEFQVTQNSARVDYTYNYDQNSGSPKMQVVSLELQKTAAGWNIVQTKMEAR